MAKESAAKILDSLMRDGLVDDADRTNWVSVVAGIQHHIQGWNEAMRKHRAAAERAQTIQ